MQTTIEGTRLLARVREGMTVLDAAGEQVGTVKAIKMGDPRAATTQGNEPPSGGSVAVGPAVGLSDLGGAWPTGGTEPDVPEPRRSHLLRVGYMKVSGGPFSEDRYVAEDEIGEVAGDTVRMAASPRVEAPTTHAPRAMSGYAPSPASLPPDVAGSDSSPWWPKASLASVGLVGIGCGVWGFRRWQRERNRPMNRLRRQARSLLQQLPEPDDILDRVPAVDERSGPLAVATLFGLAAGWLLRERTRPAIPDERAGGLLDSASDRVPASKQRLLEAVLATRQRAADLASEPRPGAGRPMFAVLALAGVGLVLLVRRITSPAEKPLYIGTPGVESALGRDRTRSGEVPSYMAQEHPRTP